MIYKAIMMTCLTTGTTRSRIWSSNWSGIVARGLTIAACVIVSSCVSSTLQNGQTGQTSASKPAPATSELALSAEERQIQDLRAQAISQIHAKADAYVISEEAPAYGELRKGETSLLTPAQVEAKTNALNNLSNKSQTLVPDAKIDAKKREIAEMQRKGNTHYKDALAKIRNDQN